MFWAPARMRFSRRHRFNRELKYFTDIGLPAPYIPGTKLPLNPIVAHSLNWTIPFGKTPHTDLANIENTGQTSFLESHSTFPDLEVNIKIEM